MQSKSKIKYVQTTHATFHGRKFLILVKVCRSQCPRPLKHISILATRQILDGNICTKTIDWMSYDQNLFPGKDNFVGNTPYGVKL